MAEICFACSVFEDLRLRALPAALRAAFPVVAARLAVYGDGALTDAELAGRAAPFPKAVRTGLGGGAAAGVVRGGFPQISQMAQMNPKGKEERRQRSIRRFRRWRR